MNNQYSTGHRLRRYTIYILITLVIVAVVGPRIKITIPWGGTLSEGLKEELERNPELYVVEYSPPGAEELTTNPPPPPDPGGCYAIRSMGVLQFTAALATGDYTHFAASVQRLSAQVIIEGETAHVYVHNHLSGNIQYARYTQSELSRVFQGTTKGRHMAVRLNQILANNPNTSTIAGTDLPSVTGWNGSDC